MKQYLNGVTLAILVVVLGIGCQPGEPGSQEGQTRSRGGRIRIVATTGMIKDLVVTIGGDLVNVDGLIGSGVDPHLYKPTVSDVKKLQKAEIIFYNGLKLEGKMGDVLEKVKKGGRPVVAISESLKNLEGYLIDESEGHEDPHIWMDVNGWIAALDVVVETLGNYKPEAKQDFEQSGVQYKAELEALDSYCKDALNSIPQSQRILVTAHDAFNYMARAYGISVRGIQGISTESEAGVREIEELVDFIVDSKIPAVFVESSVSDKNVRALIEGAQARKWEVKIGGQLFSDAMGLEGTYKGTYIGMIDHNVTTIARSLGGQAPEFGLNGKLKEKSETENISFK